MIYNDSWYDNFHREITILMDQAEFSEAKSADAFYVSQSAVQKN